MKVVLLFFFLLPLNLLAQAFPVDALSGKIYYAEEVLVKDGPLLDLYNRAKAWLAVSANDTTRLAVDDVANGLIIQKDYRELMVASGKETKTFRLWYTLKLEMEDDRYWYSITDFQLQGEPLSQIPTVKNQENKVPLESLVLNKSETIKKGEKGIYYKSLKTAAQESILALIKDLKANML